MTEEELIRAELERALQKDTLTGAAVGRLLMWELVRENQGKKPLISQHQLEVLQRKITAQEQKDAYNTLAALYTLLIAAVNQMTGTELYFKLAVSVTHEALLDCLNWERLSKAFPAIQDKNQWLETNGEGAIFTGYTLDKLAQEDNHFDIPFYRQDAEEAARMIYAFNAMLDILAEVYKLPMLERLKLEVCLPMLAASEEVKNRLRAEVAGTYKEQVIDYIFKPVQLQECLPLKKNISRVKKTLKTATMRETLQFFGYSLVENVVKILTGAK